MTWRKSSYSNVNGGDCVEVGTAPWRTSSHSTSNGGECVEAATIGAAVAVRDSKGHDIMDSDTKDSDTKDNGAGLVLRFTPRAWTRFTATLK